MGGGEFQLPAAFFSSVRINHWLNANYSYKHNIGHHAGPDYYVYISAKEITPAT